MDNIFWDGRISVDPIFQTFTTPAGAALTPEMAGVLTYGTVAAQAMFPVVDRREMRGKGSENELSALPEDDFTGVWAALMDRIGRIPTYVRLFEIAYPGTAFEDMTFAHAANAIGAYEIRAFYRADSPFDRFLAGEAGALSVDELRGGIVFYSTGHCQGCHTGPNLSNQVYFNSGMAQLGPGEGDGANFDDDYGRERVTHMGVDRHKFRSAPLRNIELTAPYGHAGQISTLEEVVRHYQDPEGHLAAYDVTVQVEDPRFQELFVDNRQAVLSTISPFVLNGEIADTDIPDLVAFLEALTDDSARDLCDEVPVRVPSELPVDDPCL
jgi:cytochrome c peroxidase